MAQKGSFEAYERVCILDEGRGGLNDKNAKFETFILVD